MVRIKHRYLLINILFPIPAPTNTKIPTTISLNRGCPEWFNATYLLRLLRNSITENFGDYGSGITGGSLSIKYFSQATSTAIIRCPRAHYRLVWAALTFIGGLIKYGSGRRGDEEKVDCVIRTVRVSGTIKKAEEEAIRRARRQIVLATQDGNTLDTMFRGQELSDPEDMEMEDEEESG